MKKIVILISGTGSNMQAIAQAASQEAWATQLNAEVVAVISNRPDAKGLLWARERELSTAVVDHKEYATRESFDQALAAQIDVFAPTLVVLAGFMRILTPAFVAHYRRRLLNIHPSLLPAFPGTHTHQRAIESGCKFAGTTVHWVTEELDGGPIIDQAIVPVLPDDTASSLAARVLSQEHLLYASAIREVLPSLSVAP